MYYHSRELKYVEYDKVFPAPEEKLDWLLPAYKWLGHYCGYCPQVWLSRSTSSITGFRSSNMLKKRKNVKRKRSEKKDSNNSVLFGVDVVKGFPVSYEHWCFILNVLINEDCKGINAVNKKIAESMNYCLEDYEGEGGVIGDWKKCNGNFAMFLNRHLFNEVDQIVVPSLNLKAAKKIICRDEKAKKKLRKMGFIEDRIQIKNMKRMDW